MEEKRKATTESPPTTAADAPPSSSDAPPPRRRGQKRKSVNTNTSSPAPAQSAKRQARDKSQSAQLGPIQNGPLTRARQQDSASLSLSSEASAAAAEVVKREEVAAVSVSVAAEGGEKEESKVSAEEGVDWEALERRIEAKFDVVRSRERNAHVVPNHCGWFSWTKIHPLEEQSLPSFFNRKSETRTPEIYLEIRNSIMKRYHSNPNNQIDEKDLAELSVGELDARQEVMEFLDYWGLINYHPFPEADNAKSTVDPNEEVDGDSLIQKLYQFATEQSYVVAPKANATAPTVPSRLLPESVVSEDLVTPEGPDVEYHCNSCSADCSRKRYHCQKQADYDLCTDCFNGGKFDSDMSPADFILMEPAEAAGANGGKWTDQETLLLLEAVELFSENWNEIAEHVATKTKSQCILQFVQMPIEDTFLEGGGDDNNGSPGENTDLAPTNNDASANNVAPETAECKDGSDDASANNVAPETTECKDGTTGDQNMPTPMEISNLEDAGKPKVGHVGSEDFTAKALKEAFEAVGSLPSPEEKLSFADAGNPVMALAVFLRQLTEPNFVTVSARSALKSIVCDDPGVQLASRHCFFLQGPADEEKRTSVSERCSTGTVELEGQKNENEGKKEEEKSNLVEDYIGSSKDDNEKGKDLFKEEEMSSSHDKSKDTDIEDKRCSGSPEKNRDLITEKERLASLTGESTQKLGSETEPHVVPDEHVKPSVPNESSSPQAQKEKASTISKETNSSISKIDVPTISGKKPDNFGEKTPAVGESQSVDAPKDEETMPSAVPLEKTEPHQSTTPTSLDDIGANSGKKETKQCKEEKEHPESEHEIETNKIKCAAVTAISAAAVKAKLLAEQEEDQIRQLAVSVVEKQLSKLESKLAFFAEMESVVARVKEQFERSKQRLYHERAQIIATRIGMPGSSARPMQQPLPNRVAMTFPNAVQRPSMSMMSVNSPRPPMPRPMMAPTSPFSNHNIPATVSGHAAQPLNQDQASSVGMQ